MLWQRTYVLMVIEIKIKKFQDCSTHANLLLGGGGGSSKYQSQTMNIEEDYAIKNLKTICWLRQLQDVKQ